MKSTPYRPQVVAAILVSALFVAGIYWLFQLRFERGDVYPPYSSYRADPMGCKALYESLDAYEGITVERALEPFDKLDDVEGSAFLNLGVVVSPLLWEDDFVRDIRRFVYHGGRMVITFAPVTRPRDPWIHEDADDEEDDGSEEEGADAESGDSALPVSEAGEDRDATADDGGDDDESGDDDEEDSDEDSGSEEKSRFMKQSLAWGVTNVVLDLDPVGVAKLAAQTEGPKLPDTLPTRTLLAFGAIDEEWRPVYTIDGHPVVLERALGEGTIIISSLSYVISNEAIRNDRQASYLAWLVGPHDHAVFNEYAHGMVYRTGIAALGRKYDLEFFCAGLLVLAGLFVWRSVAPLVPPGARDRGTQSDLDISTGRGSGSALVNLLRRNIPRNRILTACYTEWKRTRGHQALPEDLRSGIADVFREDRTAPPTRRNPARTYNRLHHILSEKYTRKETP